MLLLYQHRLKEYQDVVQISDPSVRSLFMNQTQHDAQVAKEQQEYLDALNKQEVAEQELNNMKEQYKNMYNAYNTHIQDIKSDREKLQSLRFKQEELLGKIFNDSYGSDKEWKLEMELDLLAEKKERIKTAHYKWTNAQNFTSTAAAQINWATKRWGQILSHNVQAQMVSFMKWKRTVTYSGHLICKSKCERNTMYLVLKASSNIVFYLFAFFFNIRHHNSLNCGTHSSITSSTTHTSSSA